MTGAEAARGFVERGWQIRYRGGNSVCSTPSDLDLIVADARGDPPSRYSIATWPSSDLPPEDPGGIVLDLYDADRGVAARVRRVPTPERAAQLLARYGVADNEAWDVPLVPEGAEEPVSLGRARTPCEVMRERERPAGKGV